MKVFIKQGHLLVESEVIVKLFGYLNAGKHGASKARAVAFWPLIVVRNFEETSPILINHERIHLRQQIELLIIGNIMLFLIERLYLRYNKGLRGLDVYLCSSTEQEAYQNQHNLEYLATRKIWSQFRYFHEKRTFEFITGQEPQVILRDKVVL